MRESIPIGTIVELKIPCLGNPVGSRGICFDVYELGEPGSQVIFQNGDHCGFSIDEQDTFFNIIKRVPLTYQFINVMKLSDDFRKGVFKPMEE